MPSRATKQWSSIHGAHVNNMSPLVSVCLRSFTTNFYCPFDNHFLGGRELAFAMAANADVTNQQHPCRHRETQSVTISGN